MDLHLHRARWIPNSAASREWLKASKGNKSPRTSIKWWKGLRSNSHFSHRPQCTLSPLFFITIVFFNFFWNGCNTHERLETMVMCQFFFFGGGGGGGGVKRCFLVYGKMVVAEFHTFLRNVKPHICWHSNRPFAQWRHFITTTRILVVFPFIFKFGNSSEVWITKALICTRKQSPKRFWS